MFENILYFFFREGGIFQNPQVYIKCGLWFYACLEYWNTDMKIQYEYLSMLYIMFSFLIFSFSGSPIWFLLCRGKKRTVQQAKGPPVEVYVYGKFVTGIFHQVMKQQLEAQVKMMENLAANETEIPFDNGTETPFENGTENLLENGIQNPLENGIDNPLENGINNLEETIPDVDIDGKEGGKFLLRRNTLILLI